MRTILNIPLGGHEEAGRSRVIAATILRAADERQPFCTAVHGDVLVIDGTFPGSVFDPDILHENDDAGTADTFLQCCVFADYVEKHGDVVFG